MANDESLVPRGPELQPATVEPSLPSSFRDSLPHVQLYDLPGTATVELAGGAQIIKYPAAVFEYAGNIYMAPKNGGKVPTDPTQWSLVAGDSSPNLAFYHGRNRDHLEAMSETGLSLSTKVRLGTLPESTAQLSADHIGEIILAKEKPGGGVQAGDESSFHGIVNEHGEQFLASTPGEIAGSWTAPHTEARGARIQNERLLLHTETGYAFKPRSSAGWMGEAFSDPRERVFYATHPEQPGKVRRLKIGFEEVMTPEGTRAHRPSVKETVMPVGEALREIGPKANIAHAPEGISTFMRTGDAAGLEDFAKRHLIPELQSRQSVNNHFAQRGSFDSQTLTHHMMGEELAGAELTNQAWYRVLRPEDYVAPGVGGETGSAALETAGHRVLDSRRADYFLIREHPDFTAHIKSLGATKYEGPTQEILFLKGDPTGKALHQVEKIGAEEFGHDIALELGKRGITPGTKLVKIGEDEYAEL